MKHKWPKVKIAPILFSFSLLILAHSLPLTARAEVPWPTKGWAVDQEFAGSREMALNRFLEYLFPPAENKDRLQTDSILVIKDGRIILERYANEYSPIKPHIAWSVTKSITNAILGLSIMDNKLKLQDSICKYIKKIEDEEKCAIKLIDVAQHASGLDWVEAYEELENPEESPVIAMLYGDGINDMVSFILNLHEVAHKPGTFWRYSSADSNLLMAAIQGAYGAEFAELPWKRLFDAIGMKSVVWESDHKNILVGSSYVYATPRDLARFGYLYLQDGIWEGERILPEGWVRFSTQMAPALAYTQQRFHPQRPTDVYGIHWWINWPIPHQGLPAPWPSAPPDTFAALGHWGQAIFVIPSRNIIAVRTATDRRNKIDWDIFTKLLLELAE